MTKKQILLYIFLFMILNSINSIASVKEKEKEKPMKELVVESLDFAVEQYKAMLEKIADTDELPRTTNPDGTLKTEGSRSWTSGFFPGSLWYLYEYTGNQELRKAAHKKTMYLQREMYNVNTHDLGFMLFCSFGNGYQLTGNRDYRDIIIRGSESLCTRFNPTICSIQSWGRRPNWQFPVIIDNMMNLEMLFWASKSGGNPAFKKLAEIHANTTMKHHFRDDYSSYHVVSYDTLTGKVEVKNTAQGYADGSAWARGQAWGLYGYTMSYRETKNPAYLELAKNIARFIIDHPNLSEDKIPYWDFNAPDIPSAKRDASSAAIICSALLELKDYCDDELSQKCLKTAEKIIRSLSSPTYRSGLGENNCFILKHSVGHMPSGVEIDVPLNYADYYYIESLMRYNKMIR